MPEILALPFTEPLADRLMKAPTPGTRLFWLGQAGFIIEAAGRRIVIDPYLSDSLAEKYRHGRFSHERMMPPPVLPDELAMVDLVVVTHHHSDHMDPETLKPLMNKTPDLRMVAPAASRELASQRSGVAQNRLILLDVGDEYAPFNGIRITATPAAHEVREKDERGQDRFLGYLMDVDGFRIWHSGDGIPFDGLVGLVKPLKPDLGLLPVNGRSPTLSNHGVPGNFSLEEAIATASAVGAKTLIAHHYGMFAFNTADPGVIDAAAIVSPIQLLRAQTGFSYEVH